MLGMSVLFLFTAFLAAYSGSFGLAANATSVAQILFFSAIVLLVTLYVLRTIFGPSFGRRHVSESL